MTILEKYFKRIDTKLIYPPLLVQLEKLVENLSKQGLDFYVISGHRSWEEQDKLYEQGRDKKGKVIDKSKVVTNAKGGQSNHNFSIAADLCFDADMKRDGLQPSWELAKYKPLADEAQKLGLEAGMYWKFVDAPHIQLNLSKHGLSFKDLQVVYLKNKSMADVWKFLDKYKWF